jgi:hypothetical protein
MLPSDCLHLLTIDLETAAGAVRAAFEFSGDERRELLLEAGESGIPLLLLVTPRSFHLVSTYGNHVRAFRPALTRMRDRTHAAEAARAVPVRIAQGRGAARQFLHHATPLSRDRAAAQEFMTELREAASLALSCRAFSEELGALCQMAEQTAARIEAETRLRTPSSSRAELEVETLAAERIVEEELLAWQSSYPALRASLPPVSMADLDLFPAEEPNSRLRLSGVKLLSKLRLG